MHSRRQKAGHQQKGTGRGLTKGFSERAKGPAGPRADEEVEQMARRL